MALIDHINQLVKIASVADYEGDYDKADVIGGFLRMAQSLSLDSVLKDSPGAEMATKNLTDSAYGAQTGYFQERGSPCPPCP
jgi:hypothetical protein